MIRWYKPDFAQDYRLPDGALLIILLPCPTHLLNAFPISLKAATLPKSTPSSKP